MKNQAITIIGVGIVAYFILNHFFGQKTLTKEQTVKHIHAAGGTITQGTEGTFWHIPDGVVSLDQKFNPNLAQKIFIGVDKFIPSDWLTRKVYGV